MSLINTTVQFVKKTLHDAEGGHDWFHIERVWNNAKRIALGEQVNLEVVELGALLHDIADSKFHNGDEQKGPEMARQFLSEQAAPQVVIDEVTQIVTHISFKGGHSDSSLRNSREFDVVQDADRLDAMGAIGIARCFNYGGFKNRVIFDANCPPSLTMTKEEYKASKAPSINHFYEKLLRLKSLMNTPTGKALAEQRHQFMILYLKQFFDEVGINEESFLHQL